MSYREPHRWTRDELEREASRLLQETRDLERENATLRERLGGSGSRREAARTTLDAEHYDRFTALATVVLFAAFLSLAIASIAMRVDPDLAARADAFAWASVATLAADVLFFVYRAHRASSRNVP